jgi:hypothetical protein
MNKQEYLKNYRQTYKQSIKKYNHKWYLKHKNEVIEKSRIYHNQHSAKHKMQMRNYQHRLRVRTLEIVGKGKLECSNCGCRDIRLLEINHINGKGTKELNRLGSLIFYQKIRDGKRSIKDLSILCKVCNWAYFIKQKYGISYKIKLNS